MRHVLWSVLALGGLAGPVLAVTIDGHLDPGYGPARVTQTTQTQYDNLFEGSYASSDGDELDQGFAFIADSTLYLFVSGNIGFCCPIKFSHQENLAIFFDTGAGGQHVLRGDNPFPAIDLAGLTFDPGLAPDYELMGVSYESAYYATLPAGGPGVGYYLGNGYQDGHLTGGTNPYNVRYAMVDTNTAGVTLGCGASSGLGVTTGAEWAVPLAALGNPTDSIRICALEYGAPGVLNQVLAPLPPGSCNPGPPASVDFGSYAGAQYFTVFVPPLGVAPGGSWPLAIALAEANPARGGSIALRLTLPVTGPALVELFDVAGRVLRAQTWPALEAGRHTLSLGADGVRGGIYWLRLTQGSGSVATRAVLLR